eukprot:CAMPEP_0197273552 /NCGR_PEP_ID=MMETSP1432-20130617/11423_1 /TAXON_ID=44447 /ORGANISM="Pseudo-nitzschia delicatissima, Strain UNC1205" /LENGTH=235 /DNA_ID=CAMNT_0042739225 /DNA_START=32 /DNA_END=739 /DNA_ORIENTATION=+
MVLDEIDGSLRTEDLFEMIKEEDGSTKETNSLNEISLDLDNMLQEIQEERDSGPLRFSSQAVLDSCASLNHDDESMHHDDEDDDFHQSLKGPQHIGSGLRLEDLPSPRGFTDPWWSSGSTNFLGSFKKKMGSSFKLLKPYHQRRKDASTKHFDASAKASASSDDGSLVPSPCDMHSHSPRRKNKVVRFKKFDTVYPFWKSFSMLQRNPSEDGTSCCEIDENHRPPIPALLKSSLK